MSRPSKLQKAEKPFTKRVILFSFLRETWQRKALFIGYQPEFLGG
jgi:hypothetical protein